MSIPLPTYEPPPSVAFESELSWFLKEQVVIEWQDTEEQSHYLGGPSPLNKSMNLVLWAGHNEEEKSLVIMLQLTTTHYVSARKKKVDVFLVPTHLQIEDDCESVITVGDAPSEVVESFEQFRGLSKSMRILSLSLQKSIPSQAVMAIRHTKDPKPLGGTPLHLMLAAKSFSEEATTFDAYIRFSTYAIAAWKRAMSALQQGYTTAEFDLESMYNHNGGGSNLWDAYIGTKITRTASEVDLDPRHPPKNKQARCAKDTTETSDQDHEDVPPPYLGSPAHVNGSPEPAPSNLADKLDCVEVQVAASEGFLSPPRYEKAGSVIPVTPMEMLRNRKLGSPCIFSGPTIPRPSPQRLQYTAAAIRHVPLDTNFEPIAEPGNVVTSLQQCFINWLYEMKKMDRDVHELPELYQLLVDFGVAIQRGEVAQIPVIKSECTCIVLKRHITLEASGYSSTTPTPEQLVQRLISWMCSIILDADVALIDDLTVLMRKAIAWGCFMSGDSTEKGPLEDLTPEQDYMFHEAICIASLFTTYGGVLSRQAKI